MIWTILFFDMSLHPSNARNQRIFVMLVPTHVITFGSQLWKAIKLVRNILQSIDDWNVKRCICVCVSNVLILMIRCYILLYHNSECDIKNTRQSIMCGVVQYTCSPKQHAFFVAPSKMTRNRQILTLLIIKCSHRSTNPIINRTLFLLSILFSALFLHFILLRSFNHFFLLT